MYNIGQMSALYATWRMPSHPQNLLQDFNLGFSKEPLDRSRRDIPYKERNPENLQIAPVPMEAGGGKENTTTILKEGKDNNCCNYVVVIMSLIRNLGGALEWGGAEVEKRLFKVICGGGARRGGRFLEPVLVLSMS